MMPVNTKYRSNEQEIMDDLNMEGEMLRKTLNQIARINKHLGGNKATLAGLKTLLNTRQKDKAIYIVDLGCGSGDMLRAVADYGRKNNYTFRLTGIDANEYTVNYAAELSTGYPEINFCKMDIFSDEFSYISFDIAMATLFFHHFTNREIEKLLIPVVNKAQTGVIINDLHRSRLAYYLFKGMSTFIKNPMVKKDGAISVLRGFKKEELLSFSKKLKNVSFSVRWKWAFRYQWIIKKVCR